MTEAWTASARIGDQFLTALITADAVRALKLRHGDDALAIIKVTREGTWGKIEDRLPEAQTISEQVGSPRFDDESCRPPAARLGDDVRYRFSHAPRLGACRSAGTIH
jgi:hypothetical protein